MDWTRTKLKGTEAFPGGEEVGHPQDTAVHPGLAEYHNFSGRQRRKETEER
jgi:hypothetical protein